MVGSTMPMPRSCKVAVIGAGVSGLTAARELRLEGHDLVVFEKSERLGGTWVYDPSTESDPLGVDPGRRVVHSSLYRSLRTNLPRPLMGFLDFPFARSYGDPRAFPAHGEVLAFLEDFAREFGIIELVRFGTEVVRVSRGPSGAKDEWVVESRRSGEETAVAVETFQAVVVCNGHYTEPRIAQIPGIDKWHGKQIHSHNYRTREPFQNLVVVLIGKGPSAFDIYKDISKIAKEVHLTSWSPEDVEIGKLDGHDNIWQHSKIKYVYEDGKVDFNEGSSVFADVIFHCTGYKYHFPFLEPNEIVEVDDNRVGPLYKHVFPPSFAPWISLVGLPNKSVIFLTIDLQSKWISQVLSGKVDLPSEETMISSVNELYAQLEELGRPKHHTHFLHPNEDEYLNWLVAELGLPPLEEWRVQMYRAVMKKISSRDHSYRDTWDADYWDQQSVHL